MPVCVFHRQRAWNEFFADIGRNGGADMRQADQQRHRSAMQGEDGVAHAARSFPPTTTRRQGLWPNQ